MTPRRSVAATALRRTRHDATAPRPSRAARPRVRSPRHRRSRPWPRAVTWWRPTCPSVPVIDDHQSSQAHLIRVSTLSGRGIHPCPAGYPGAAGGGASITVPGFPLPFGHRRSLLGSSCARRGFGFPHGQPTSRNYAAGIRRGCHVPHETDTTGEGALCTPGTVVRSRPAKFPRAAPVASQRPAPTSRWNIPSGESANDEASTKVHAIHPSGLPQPVAPGWNGNPWAFPRASHPAVTRDARRDGDGPHALDRALRLRHQPNLL